ncbi:MAG: aminotransferase class IV [Deltaproteobacteria bacterium]|nr:aminotransferase class IV [Deltaproteobacteria bacterium]
MSSPVAFVWLNDELLPASQACISVHDRGLLYGDGFFETIRAENGSPWFLSEHLNRLRAAAEVFRIPFPQGIDWQARVERLLAANGLTERLAAVKILLTRGEAIDLGLPAASRPTLIIYARPYTPPGPGEYAAGWPVAIFPEPRTTFLGRYKSLNYLFYLAARQYALDQGAREALILESDGLVSEGAATSIIFVRDGRYFTPQAPSALAGVTLAVLARAILRRNIRLETKPMALDELRQAEGLWLVNSLMGVMPVAAVDGQAVRLAPEATDFLQDCLTSEVTLSIPL